MEQALKLFLGDYPRHAKSGDKLTDVEAMRLAIAEGWRGVGRVSPNPPVGCVILSKDGYLLAKGFHTQFGAPHAEAAALARLASMHELTRASDREWNLEGIPSNAIEGARVFVTLEPCAHIGKTPSCAQTFARLPLGEVVFGLIDPNPLVAGKGRGTIENAGIRCRRFEDLGLEVNLNRELNDLCEHFLVNFQESRPFITLKVATSLDGVFGLKTGESQWITGEKARNFAQFFRGTHDAILVGRTTVARDNPSLTIRHPSFSDVRKKIVVVDSRGVLLERPDLKLFKLHNPENLIWAVGDDYQGKPKIPVELVRMGTENGSISLNSLHDRLWELGVRSLFVEAGGKTLSAHLRARAADRLLLFQAPLILGADTGRVFSEGFGITNLNQGLRLDGVRRVSVGEDLLVTGRILFRDND